MKIKKAKSWKAKCDKLFSQLVRSPGSCRRCGSNNNLQCAHVISRRYSATRTDLANAWVLCAGCHLRLTLWPLEHMEFVKATIGMDTYRELKLKAETVTKMDWEQEYKRLSRISIDTSVVGGKLNV